MTIALISIFSLTTAIWTLSKRWGLRICPLCAGVSLTWAWLLVAMLLGARVDVTVPAILMGGSVVGLYSKLDIRNLFWKSIFVGGGFAAVYALLEGHWLVFILALLVAAKAGFGSSARTLKPSRSQGKVEELKKKMDECC